jgi:hypothetical protein
MKNARQRMQSGSPRRLRARVSRSFARLANGVGATAAFTRAKAYFRAGGRAWAQSLG